MDSFHDPYQPSNLFDFQSPSNVSTGMFVPEGRGTQPVKQGMRDIHDLNLQMNQEQEKLGNPDKKDKKAKKEKHVKFEDETESDSDSEEPKDKKDKKDKKPKKAVKTIEGFEDGFRSLSNGFYLVLIYLVISSNYLGNLFGCRVQQMLSTNVYMKHLLGFFTTYFFIVLATPPQGSTNMSLLGFAALIYGWFFITTKMSVTYWIPMILCVLLAYFLYQYNKQEEETMKPDVKQRIQMVQSALTVVAGIITVVGVVMYYGEKKLEYGPSFKPSEFWVGLPSCKNKTPNFTMGNRFRAAFN